MAKSPKAELVHTDLVGEILQLGDFVGSFYNSSMHIFVIDKINPKMIKLKRMRASNDYFVQRYPHDTIKLNHEQAMFKILST